MAGRQRKGWSQLSIPYRKRLRGAGIGEAEYNAGIPLNKARGKPANEYQQRKQREKTKAGVFHPLTPAQIKQLKKFGATDIELHDIREMPRRHIQALLRQQRENEKKYHRNPRFKAEWTLDEMKADWPDTPPIMFYYRSSSIWSR